MDMLMEERMKRGWSHVEAMVYGFYLAERDALLWALGEEPEKPAGERAYRAGEVGVKRG
jgi:hypothetical protein